MRYHVAPSVQSQMEELFKSLITVRNLTVLQAVYDVLLSDLFSSYAELCPGVEFVAPADTSVNSTDDSLKANPVAKALFVFNALSGIGAFRIVLRSLYQRSQTKCFT
jgi:hypothetical protein